MKNPTFAIIGGGIGGLTLAISLHRRGFQTTVYEQTPEVKPLGAGLVLAANAIKALNAIGIDAKVIQAGKALKKLIIKDTRGNILTETDSRDISKKYGAVDNFTIHRADLHDVLIHELSPDTIQLGKTCIDFKQSSAGVTLYFQDGTSDEKDYVIACDGIHSIFRRKLIMTSKPRYSGYTCWRAVINDVPSEVNADETIETWGPGSRFGMVPLTGNRLYWFACLNANQNDPAMKAYKIADLLKHFGDFHDPIPEILKRTKEDQLIWGDIIDLKPINKFAFSNIVLIGDAAHATTPNMGQGACMAIEDAVVLAACLSKHTSPIEAFRKFESARLSRTTKIVSASWTLGRVAQLENPFLIWLRNAAIRATPEKTAEKQMKFLYEVSFD